MSGCKSGSCGCNGTAAKSMSLGRAAKKPIGKLNLSAHKQHNHEQGHEHDHSHGSCGHSHAGKHADHAPVRDHLHDHQDQSVGRQGAAHVGGCCSHDHAPRSQAVAGLRTHDFATAECTSMRLYIDAMDCPTEEGLIRQKLGNMAGVTALEFNLLERILLVRHDAGLAAQIVREIESLGFPVQDATAGRVEAKPAKRHRMLWLAGALALGAELADVFLPAMGWVSAVLAVLAIAACGLTTYRKGWVALKNFNLNINALMTIAVTGAVLIGHWPEAAMVMVLFALAELIEAKSLARARDAIRGLMDIAPQNAEVFEAASNSWQSVPVADVVVGARVRVKPGERIALDGKLVAGQSSVNQAPITGESLPVEKGVGDEVFAGTINETGTFEFVVTAAAGDTTLARIIHAIESAQASRAPTQRFVDQFSRYYTPAVFAVALLTAVFSPLFFGLSWQDSIYRALVLLVIACPCALVISTPVSVVSGLAAAARKGILIKGGLYLEQGRKLTWLALDKTGTITHGKPMLTDSLAWQDADLNQARQMAAQLAHGSNHPVSKALAAVLPYAAELPVDELTELPGRGVKGRIDGATYHLGNHRLVEDLKLCSPELEAVLDRFERAGQTVVMLMNETRVAALFAVADTVKESSRAAIAELHALGVNTLMLSGDNAQTVAAIAGEVGIDRSAGNLLPLDKQAEIEKLQASGAQVGMVGDGINDAPALARANIGFAMGAAGTGTAIETADVALMDDDLRKIASFVRLSRKTGAILWQNITLALVVKALFLIATFAGFSNMWMAVFADMGVSLLVVANGLRLLRS